MAVLIPDKNTIKLLRLPFSFFLMPVFLLAVSQASHPDLYPIILSFLILHLLVFPSSNGYNSYIDKDESSIGGLENPPMPTKKLLYATVFMDLLAIVLSVFLISVFFAVCVLLFILASKAYSSRQVRLKKYPLLGFVTVVFFQGAFTYYMAYAGINSGPLNLSHDSIFILVAASLQLAGAYPLTQIYQHKEDYKNGDITISYKLGYRGTFVFCSIMFIFSDALYFFYFNSIDKINYFLILQAFFMPVLVYFSWWFNRVRVNESEANFKNTMRMNLIASLCMNLCFLFFIFLKYIY